MLFLFCQKCIILRRVIQYSSYIDKFKEYYTSIYSLLKKFIIKKAGISYLKMCYYLKRRLLRNLNNIIPVFILNNCFNVTLLLQKFIYSKKESKILFVDSLIIF